MHQELKKAITNANAANNGFVDRVATKIAPKWAASRAQSRVDRYHSTMRLAAMTAASGGWKGASKSRNSTKGWTTYTNDPDSQNSGDIQTLRDRSRDQARNNPMAAGALLNVKTYVVGDRGPKLNAQLDGEFLGMDESATEDREKTIQREWDLYFNNCEFDLDRELCGPDFLTQVVYNWFSSGDVFTVRAYKKRTGSPYGTKLQNIEADLCTNPDYIADGETPSADTYAGVTGPVYSGIEKDPVTNAPVAYYFKNKFSGSSNRDEIKWTRVPAFDRRGRKNVIHMHIKDRPKQSRGVPYFAPILEPLKQLERYTDAELMAAVTSGLFSVFVTSPEGRSMSPIAGSNQTESKDDAIEMGYGNVVGLKSGETIETTSPGRPNPNFDPFFDSIIKQIGVALGQPSEILLKAFQSSYSASRAAMLEAWRFFDSIRGMVNRNWLEYVYENFYEEAVALQRIPAPGYIRGDETIRRAWRNRLWVWPAKGMIRPEVEIKAITQSKDAGFTTMEEATAQVNGGDYNSNYPQRLKEAQKERDIKDITEPETTTNDTI